MIFPIPSLGISISVILTLLIFFCLGSRNRGASNSADPSRHLLLADISAAQAASEGAVVEGTNAKQVRAWARFQHYLRSIGLSSDPYLDGFTQFQ
jgi:hypothetical protein